MPNSITQAFVQQWDTTIRLLAQQKTSRLESTILDKGDITGESFTHNQLGAIEDTPENNQRHGDTLWSDATHLTRVALMKDFYQALPVDRADEPKLIANPATTAYPQSLMNAWNRRKDKIIFAAMLGNAQTKDGAQIALPVGQKIAAGGVGFTKSKILQARKMFRAAEADGVEDGEELYCAYNSEMLEDILSDTTLTSADFMSVRMLQGGDVGGKWMGINWIPYEGILLSAGTYSTAMWAKSGVIRGTGFTEGRVQRRADKKDTLQVSQAGSYAALRCEESKVVQVSFV